MENVKSGEGYLHRIDELLYKNRLLIFFAFLNIALLIILTLGYLQLRKDLVLKVDVPPKLYSNGTLYVGAVRANELYYKVWGQYIVNEMSNYSPANIMKRLDNISVMLHPDKYVEYKHLIVKKNDFVVSNMLQREFIPMTETVEVTKDKHQGLFVSKGIATDTMGDDVNIAYKECSFKVRMSIDNYHLFINEIGEKCKVIDNVAYNDALTEIRVRNNKYKKGIK